MLKTLSKFVISFLVCAVTLATACLLWFKNGANFIYGAHTEVVDYTVFAKPIEPTATKGVNVLSPGDEMMLPGRTVVVDGGGTLSASVNNSIPATAEGINGRGKYIIPDVVDSHAHILKSPTDLLLYLAAGVTSIRDLGGRQCAAFTTPLVVRA